MQWSSLQKSISKLMETGFMRLTPGKACRGQTLELIGPIREIGKNNVMLTRTLKIGKF
jgi:hypothetical protein